jgi:hypothetical protein
MTQDKYANLAWDYNLDPAQFNAILMGDTVIGPLNQSWALARALQHLNYYDAMSIVPISTLNTLWPQVKKQIFNKNIQQGYDFVLQRYALSTTK